MTMKDAHKKILKSYRLSPKVVKALKKAAQDRHCDETWIVETILGVALGVADPPKPLPDLDSIKKALPAAA